MKKLYGLLFILTLSIIAIIQIGTPILTYYNYYKIKQHENNKTFQYTIDISNVDIRRQCIDFIKENEGFKKSPYLLDNHYYIGFGHLCSKNYKSITLYQADSLLQQDLDYKIKYIKSFKFKLNYNQELALGMLLYNIKQTDFEESGLFTALAAGYSIERDWLGFCRFNGKIHNGLLKRRCFEITIYNTKL